jgi:hypothetical protein
VTEGLLKNEERSFRSKNLTPRVPQVLYSPRSLSLPAHVPFEVFLVLKGLNWSDGFYVREVVPNIEEAVGFVCLYLPVDGYYPFSTAGVWGLDSDDRIMRSLTYPSYTV